MTPATLQDRRRCYASASHYKPSEHFSSAPSTASKRVPIQANKIMQQILVYVKSKCNSSIDRNKQVLKPQTQMQRKPKELQGQACCQERRGHSCETLLTIILWRQICGILLRQILAERSFVSAHTHTLTIPSGTLRHAQAQNSLVGHSCGTICKALLWNTFETAL